MESDEVYDTLESFKEEAMKLAINAFNEGYLLGVKHANQASVDTQNMVNECIKNFNK